MSDIYTVWKSTEESHNGLNKQKVYEEVLFDKKIH